MHKKEIAIFASGSGTNAENIIRYFSERDHANVSLILSNREDAGVLERAAKLDVPAVVFDREGFFRTNKILDLLTERNISFIVLAGFLWLVPGNILESYPGRIVNIHPALLPKYGGKGMYGSRVHQAVIENGEKESGITIHHVNEQYDKGSIILQVKCPVFPSDTQESLAERVHELEYRYYPEVIDQLIRKMI